MIKSKSERERQSIESKMSVLRACPMGIVHFALLLAFFVGSCSFRGNSYENSFNLKRNYLETRERERERGKVLYKRLFESKAAKVSARLNDLLSVDEQKRRSSGERIAADPGGSR
jgi:hypothetical protein